MDDGPFDGGRRDVTGGTMTLRGARVVREHEVVTGDVRVEDGRIVAVDPASGTGRGAGEDLGGDWLIPGLVELHTDHLEVHWSPRPGVRWPDLAAIQAHDAQVATAGITTVFDCLRVGLEERDGVAGAEVARLAESLADAAREGRLRSEHRLHLRCEVSAPGALEDFEALAARHDVHLASLMDHAPGQRQFATLEAAATYYRGTLGYSAEAFEAFVTERVAHSDAYATPQRRAIAALCRERGIPLASHDDATAGHVDESDALGVSIAEFPTSMEAACRSHELGMAVLMGAPNVVRGMSHSGNVSARELAAAGRLDVLSSDYVPFSLVQAIFLLALELRLCTLPEAVALVTANPARAAGLDDRGRVRVGAAADLVQVRAAPGEVPVVRRVWRTGRRVA